jgi:pimeloyl-ACP methyl ester carboxylesterase
MKEKIMTAKDAFNHFTLPGKRLKINGQNFYYLVQGECQPGQPLVVLEAGHADWSKCWAAVQPEIARFARTFSYDRAGSGWSDTGSSPRSPEKIVRELHELLTASGEKAPYLFVGHSMGAPLSRLYSKMYPGEITGMVWVDSAHERMDKFLSVFYLGLIGIQALFIFGWILAQLGVIRLLPKGLIHVAYPQIKDPQGQAEVFAQVTRPSFFQWLFQETAGFARGSYWKNSPRTLGNMPVIALEAQYPKSSRLPYPAFIWNLFLPGWETMHDDLKALSTHIIRIRVQSGHEIASEQPHVVVEAVKTMLGMISPGA